MKKKVKLVWWCSLKDKRSGSKIQVLVSIYKNLFFLKSTIYKYLFDKIKFHDTYYKYNVPKVMFFLLPNLLFSLHNLFFII